MIVNLPENTVEEPNVKFVEYTGENPSLCCGELRLEIDGNIFSFGRKTSDYPVRFWNSGGECGFTMSGDDYCTYGEWKIDYKRIPDEFKKYADQIDRVFNANVEFGCCGGCL